MPLSETWSTGKIKLAEEKTFLKAKKPVGEAEKGKVWDIDEKKKQKQQVALLGWDTVIKKR